MKFSWTSEKEPRFWSLRRASDGSPHGVVRQQFTASGYVGIVLKRGLPGCGPYKSPTTAAMQVEAILKRLFFPEARFSKFPFNVEKGKFKEAKMAKSKNKPSKEKKKPKKATKKKK